MLHVICLPNTLNRDSRCDKRIFPTAKPAKPRNPLAPYAFTRRDLASVADGNGGLLGISHRFHTRGFFSENSRGVF